jgi:hypothetical protein
MENGKPLHSLIPLADFKAILGLDDRDEALSRYCLITATYTIEQYCKRRLLRRKNTDYLTFTGEYLFTLREYPVRKIITISNEQGAMSRGKLIDTEFYRVIPDCGDLEDIPHCLSVSPALRLARDLSGLKVHYRAGYSTGKAPPDLASACLELAVWNMSRYRGRRIGMTGNVRGEGLEPSIPVQVRRLLEPYERRTI